MKKLRKSLRDCIKPDVSLGVRHATSWQIRVIIRNGLSNHVLTNVGEALVGFVQDTIRDGLKSNK